MFIPYHISDRDRRRTRRVINTFVAAKAVQRRRSITPPGYNAEFIAHWLDTTHDQAWHRSEKLRYNGGLGMSSIARAGGNIARTGHIQRSLDEPLGSWALSYYFDVICQTDSLVLGHDPASAEVYASTLLSWSAHYEVVQYGLIGFALCCLMHQYPSDAVHRASLYYRKRVLDHLHERLSSRVVDDVLIYALSLLIPIDDYLENTEYSRAHAMGLRATIHAIGGYDCIGQSAPAMSEAVKFSALMARSLLLWHEPIFSVGYSPNHGLGPSFTLHANPHLNLPPGFIDLIQAHYLSPSMIAVLGSFSCWRQKYVHHCHRSETPMWRPSIPTSLLTEIDNCVFIGLSCLASDSSAMAHHPASRMYRQTNRRAEMLLTFLCRDSWRVQADRSLADCLIWLFVVICTAPDPEVPPQRVQKQILRRLLYPLIPDCGLWRWEDIRKILRRFFYDENLAQTWEKTWNVYI